MPNEKANTEVEKMQYLNRHCNTNENSEKAKAKACTSGSAGISARPRFSVLRPYESMQACACLAERSDATCL